MKPFLFNLTLLCALWPLAAAADEAPPGASLAGLLEYARSHNPDLAAMQHEAAAAQARTEASDALPDPVLRAELLDITNEGATGPRLLPNQSGGARYLLMQDLPWFGKRGLQREVAEAQSAQAQGQFAANWAELASRIRAAYAMHYYASASERIALQSLALLDDLEQVAVTRYAHGLGTQQDVLRAQVEKTMLRGELIALQNERHHAHVRLNLLLARPAEAPLAEPAPPQAPPAAALEADAMQQRLLARNPQLQIAEAGIRSVEKGRELTQANRYPTVTLGISPTQVGSSIRMWDLMLQLNIPLQQASRRAQEQEAESMLAASAARRQALLNQLQAELAEALSALEAARRTEHLVATRLLPQAELGYRSALAGYETGKIEFSLLVETQRQLLKARQQQLQAQTDMQLRLADIEKLLGEEP